MAVVSLVLFTSKQPKKKKWLPVSNKVTLKQVKLLWSASCSACVVYTKTIIHISVGESGGYLPQLW